MQNVERIREALLGEPGQDYFKQRAFAGWKPVAIIWERQIDAPEAAATRHQEEVPYGLEVAPDCASLVENASEKQVLLIAFEGIIQDKRLSQIAKDLNEKGYRTRQGKPWQVTDLFHLLPRLIEVGPRVFPTHEWVERRQQIYSAM